jgi:hypothetical protein
VPSHPVPALARFPDINLQMCMPAAGEEPLYGSYGTGSGDVPNNGLASRSVSMCIKPSLPLIKMNHEKLELAGPSRKQRGQASIGDAEEGKREAKDFLLRVDASTLPRRIGSRRARRVRNGRDGFGQAYVEVQTVAEDLLDASRRREPRRESGGCNIT